MKKLVRFIKAISITIVISIYSYTVSAANLVSFSNGNIADANDVNHNFNELAARIASVSATPGPKGDKGDPGSPTSNSSSRFALSQLARFLNNPDSSAAYPYSALDAQTCPANSSVSASATISNKVNINISQLLGHEAISDLYEFTFIGSSNDDSNISTLIGSSANININTPNGSRNITGIVTKAGKTYATGGSIVYAISLEPEMSKLKLEKNYKIYQQMNRGSIIQDILFSAGISPEMFIQNNGKILEMSVMYNQSRLSYLQSLVEEFGIAYFFNGSSVIFTDNPANYLESGASLLFVGEDFNISSINTESQSYAFSYYIAQKSMASKFTTAAYDFQSAITITNSVGSGQAEKYSFNFTDTSLSDVITTSNISAGRENSANNLHNGISNNPLIAAGYKFNVSVSTGSKSTPLVGNYVATEINHALSTSADGNCLVYANSFSSLQSSIIFKPTIKSAKVKAAGITTAIVVGPAGETKYTDADGRIKIQFHWDQQGTNDESSSAWVRVATPVDRLNDKLLYIPLIGTEVIVSFLNGDPSLPVVTGSVYNKDYQAPLALPANKFANGGQANTDLPL